MTKRKKQARLKTEQKDNRKSHTIRFSDAEFAIVTLKSNKFTGGNISEWVRYTSVHFNPQSSDLERLK